MIAAIVGRLLLGWILADFLGGLFHWWEDRIGQEEWPPIGAWLIAPNRLHHSRPRAFLETSFLERNLAAIVTALVVAIAWTAAFGFSIPLAAATFGLAISNEVHAWGHTPTTAPRLVRVLQETGFLQSPRHHAVHHRPPQDRNYCVLTNWLNPLLEELRFWERLERAVGLNPGSIS